MPSTIQSRFLATLALSLLLHVLLGIYVVPGINFKPTTQSLSPTRAVEFRLIPAQREVFANPTRAAAQNKTAAPAAPSKRSAQPPIERPQPELRLPRSEAPRIEVRSLDLSLPSSPSVSSYPLPEQRAPGTSDIFDQRLSRRVAKQRELGERFRRTVVGRTSDLEGEQSMVGGQWTSFFRVGDKCFDIIAADPLDSLSVEHWYPVSCD